MGDEDEGKEDEGEGRREGERGERGQGTGDRRVRSPYARLYDGDFDKDTRERLDTSISI